MKGKYTIVVKDARLQYKFTIQRNITILRGDSATGKTTLIDMIAAYQANGIASGVTIESQVKCCVLTGINWQANLSMIQDSIVFIDEGDNFVKSQDFAEAILGSSNYYVIATRASLFNLPYSINEIYGIKNISGNKYQGTKRLYSTFYPLYSDKVADAPKPDVVVVEDSNAGYEFYKSVCDKYDIKCISAGGKSNIFLTAEKCDTEVLMIIADGAAFGPELERILSLRRLKKVILYFPESFEWIVLKSGLIEGVSSELDTPEEYIDCQKYFSWERFFTALLERCTQDTYLRYSKNKLNPVYLQEREKNRIMASVPVLGALDK